MRKMSRLKGAVLCLSLSVACGGGGGGTPTAPAPPTGLPAGSACGALGSAAPSLDILNGTACSAEVSAVVLLNMRDKDGFGAGACSGTVISQRAILTAAHCLDGDVRIVPK